MNKLFLTISVLLTVFSLHAQDEIKATKEDVTFYNKIADAFKQALPQAFHDWDVSLHDKDREPMREGAPIGFCEGVDCWRRYETTAKYDGSQVLTDDTKKLQTQMRELQMTDKAYAQKMGVLGNTMINNTELDVVISANITSVGTLTYCKPKGFQKLAPPAGWNSFYSSGGTMACYPYSFSGNESTVDISIFSMGVLPVLTERKGDRLYKGELGFTLNPALMKTHKVLNVVLYIKGSKEKALELVKSMNTAALQKLLTL